jgi:uncharacterized membrane protein YkvA (DUF1232 family)
MPLSCLDSIAQESASAPNQNGAIPRARPDVPRNRLRASMAALALDVVFLYRLLRHPNTRWYTRGLLFLPVMYLCSPVQLIPNFIPVLGQMDDLLVIWIAKKAARKLVDEKDWRDCHSAALATRLPFSMQKDGVARQQTRWDPR